MVCLSLGFQSIALICNNFLEMQFLKVFFVENRYIWMELQNVSSNI